MNGEERNLTLDGMSGKHLILVLLATGIVCTCLYLNNHYMEAHYPTGMGSSGLCDISSYFNCDSATFSSVSNIFKIPVALFGLLFGILLIVGSIFPSRSLEETNKFLTILNLVGCALFFLYSIFILHSLCPFCTLYYLLSAAVWFLYYKFGVVSNRLNVKVIAWYALFFLVVLVPIRIHIDNKDKYQEDIASDLIKQFYGLNNLGMPQINSTSFINQATENFADAPIRMSIFSDFQCPACKALSYLLPKIVKKYKDKINIQYFFYPLDQHCNDSMKRELHLYACHAAYIAFCAGNDFVRIHDEIFKYQEKIDDEWLDKFAKKNGLAECAQKEETKQRVKDYIKLGGNLSIRSTPSYLVNGVKIEGVLKLKQLAIIFDEILRRDGK